MKNSCVCVVSPAVRPNRSLFAVGRIVIGSTGIVSIAPGTVDALTGCAAEALKLKQRPVSRLLVAGGKSGCIG